MSVAVVLASTTCPTVIHAKNSDQNGSNNDRISEARSVVGKNIDAFHGRPRWSEKGLSKWVKSGRVDGARVINYRAKLVVNGYSVEFDEFIVCDFGSYAYGERKSRNYFSRKLPDRSIVFVRNIGSICYTWQNSWRKIRYTKREIVPSKLFLMQYFWADDQVEPARIEAYLSHQYFSQKETRVKVLSQTIRLAPYPATRALLRAAVQQAAQNTPLPFLRRSRNRWMALFAVRRSAARFRNIESKIRLRIRGNISSPIHSIFDISARRKLLGSGEAVGIDWLVLRYGIPRRGEMHSLLTFRTTRQALNQTNSALGNRSYLTLDNAIPVKCRSEVCEVLVKERGYLIFHRFKGASLKKSVRFISIDGAMTRISSPADAMYLPSKGEFYVLNRLALALERSKR